MSQMPVGMIPLMPVRRLPILIGGQNDFAGQAMRMAMMMMMTSHFVELERTNIRFYPLMGKIYFSFIL